jgi:uncharacterized membrane protein YphA (DoxX/SURF4 family)
MSLPSSRTYAGVLGIVRALTGVIWLIHAIPKFRDGASFLPPNGIFAQYLQHGIASTTGPYHDFMATVVAPNAALFAEMVRVGELLVGLSLLFGIFTRLGAFVGVLLPLNYMAARGALGTISGWGTIDGALALLSAVSLLLPTGRFAGIDALRRRAVRRPTVVAEVVPERPMDGPTAPP